VVVRKTPLERFAEKVVPDQDGHWRWAGFIDKGGYGRFYFGGRMAGAHQAAWKIFIGPIPTGLEPDHVCRIRDCANPTHLEIVTRKENVLRGAGPSAVHARQTHCRRGHEFTPENTLIRLTGRRCRACYRQWQWDRRHAT